MAKVRVGGPCDGGYVMLDDFRDVQVALSLGIGQDVSWDLAIAQRGIAVHQYDHTVSGPPVSHPNFVFRKLRVGGKADSGGVVVLGALLSGSGGKVAPTLLKCDIDGDEWEVLDATTDEVLIDCTQIVCEFHDFRRVSSDDWYARAIRVLQRLDRQFAVVHVHANNYAPLLDFGGVAFPDILEVTFVNRERARFEQTNEEFPTALDAANRHDRPDIYLGAFRFPTPAAGEDSTAERFLLLDSPGGAGPDGLGIVALNETRALLAQRTSSLEVASRELVQRTEELEGIRRTLIERTQDLDEVRQTLVERTARLEATAGDLVDRTRDLDGVRALLVERTQDLGDVRQTLVERTRELDDTRATLAERTGRLEIAARELVERTRELDDTRATLAERTRLLEKAGADLVDRTRDLDETRTTLIERTALLEAIRESTPPAPHVTQPDGGGNEGSSVVVAGASAARDSAGRTTGRALADGSASALRRSAQDAAQELAEMARQVDRWATLAYADMRLRYRRTVIGPFWVTISTAILVLSVGITYGAIFGNELRSYLPYFLIGFVTWSFISQSLSEGCSVFVQAGGIIKSAPTPLTLHVLRLLMRQAITLGHNAVLIVIAWVMFQWPIGAQTLLVLPGLCLVTAAVLGAMLLLGTACTRFRDLQQFVIAGLQLMFLLSPIVWLPETLDTGVRSLLLAWNPFYYLIEVVRAPLLGQTPPLGVWLIAMIMSGLSLAAGLLFYGRYRHRVSIWL